MGPGRLAARLIGCLLLAQSLLLLIGLAVDSAPASACVIPPGNSLHPSLALALYGLGRGVMLSLDARTVAHIHVSTFSAVAISAGDVLAAQAQKPSAFEEHVRPPVAMKPIIRDYAHDLLV